jgi:hypothetical protein
VLTWEASHALEGEGCYKVLTVSSDNIIVILCVKGGWCVDLGGLARFWRVSVHACLTNLQTCTQLSVLMLQLSICL